MSITLHNLHPNPDRIKFEIRREINARHHRNSISLHANNLNAECGAFPCGTGDRAHLRLTLAAQYIGD